MFLQVKFYNQVSIGVWYFSLHTFRFVSTSSVTFTHSVSDFHSIFQLIFNWFCLGSLCYQGVCLFPRHHHNLLHWGFLFPVCNRASIRWLFCTNCCLIPSKQSTSADSFHFLLSKLSMSLAISLLSMVSSQLIMWFFSKGVTTKLCLSPMDILLCAVEFFTI